MKSELFQGRYLFHLHTVHTDGKLRVLDYFDWAAKHGVERLVFLEHIHRTPGYDVEAFIEEVRACAKRYGILAHVGFEVKLLPDGEVDIDPAHLALAEAIGLAEHGFSGDAQVLEEAFGKAVETLSPLAGKRPCVWVHPGLDLRKRGILLAEDGRYRRMIRLALDHGFWIERNLRYGLLPDTSFGEVPLDCRVLGGDVHDLRGLEIWQEMA